MRRKAALAAWVTAEDWAAVAAVDLVGTAALHCLAVVVEAGTKRTAATADLVLSLGPVVPPREELEGTQLGTKVAPAEARVEVAVGVDLDQLSRPAVTEEMEGSGLEAEAVLAPRLLRVAVVAAWGDLEAAVAVAGRALPRPALVAVTAEMDYSGVEAAVQAWVVQSSITRAEA
jgi:hypothetical protein